MQADAAWHKKTGLYPISHLLVVKDALLEDNPDIALELYRMFSEAKASYLPRLRSGGATGAFDQTLLNRAKIIGDVDPIPYGVESARKTLETFIDFNIEQGVIPSKVEPDALFPANTLELN